MNSIFLSLLKLLIKTELPNEDVRVEQLASIALAPNNALQQYMEEHESDCLRKKEMRSMIFF